jgi:hypothetical protein
LSVPDKVSRDLNGELTSRQRLPGTVVDVVWVFATGASMSAVVLLAGWLLNRWLPT